MALQKLQSRVCDRNIGKIKGKQVKKKPKIKIPPYGWNETAQTKKIYVRCPKPLLEKLEMFSFIALTTRSSIVIQALREYLQ